MNKADIEFAAENAQKLGDLISRSALHSMVCLDTKYGTYGEFMDGSEVSFTANEVHAMINGAPAVDALPVTHAELRHLINDTIDYIWRLEDRGYDTPECGYDSRKALLEKLKQFEREHFPENNCCCG